MPRNPSIKSPWAARDRVAEREAKREAVLQTAARAFAENGYHRTSLEEIAARLGVSKPTIYYYAQNKDDLVAAIAARALDEIVAAMDADEQSSALSQLSPRSEERRGGKECVSTCRSRGSQCPYKKQRKKQ